MLLSLLKMLSETVLGGLLPPSPHRKEKSRNRSQRSLEKALAGEMCRMVALSHLLSCSKKSRCPFCLTTTTQQVNIREIIFHTRVHWPARLGQEEIQFYIVKQEPLAHLIRLTTSPWEMKKVWQNNQLIKPCVRSTREHFFTSIYFSVRFHFLSQLNPT